MRLSIVVPAYNEEKLLARTLGHLDLALASIALDRADREIIVCDNASCDATASIARDAGAQVVFEPHRQIARARNAGARHARGRHLLFVDADTWPSPELLGCTLELLDGGGVCGGGCIISSRGLPLALRAMVGVWNLLSRIGGVACGAYLFCRSEAFRDVGGFDEALYAAEELELSRRLARYARARGEAFRIVTAHPLETSMRKLDLYSARDWFRMGARGIAHPLRVFKDPRYLDAWYDGRR